MRLAKIPSYSSLGLIPLERSPPSTLFTRPVLSLLSSLSPLPPTLPSLLSSNPLFKCLPS